MVLSAKSWSAPARWCARGEPTIEIVGKHPFVVVWFPVSRLYRLQVGDAVTVSTGGGDLPDKDRQGQCHCRRAAERIPERIRAHRRNTMARNEPTRPYGRILAGDGGLGPRFHLSARHRALPPEREWSAKRYPADALPFGMQYCLRKLRELPLMKILVVDDHALIREALH